MFESDSPRKLKFSLILPVVWFSTTSLIIFLLIFALLFMNSSTLDKPDPKYSIYSSKPLVLGATTSILDGKDPRAAKIDKVFEVYSCPRTDLGDTFVNEADKNGIPYWIVAAISFQESNCGKKTPELEDGSDSNNWWGYGVWGENVKGFETVEEGISKVSGYLNTNFFSQGVTEPCEIMKTYTPPSKGSWCAGVEYFGEIIEEYKTPSL